METTLELPATQTSAVSGVDRTKRKRAVGAALLASVVLALGVQALAVPAASADSGIRVLALKVDPRYQLVGGQTKLIAQYNADVGPTPYWIHIFDQATGAKLASCGSGYTCSATVSQGSAMTRNYVAYVARWGTTNPPPDVQKSATASATWRANLVLNRPLSEPVVYEGNAATVTATSAFDVGPTPYYIYIVDQTTNTRVKVCGSGTTCTAKPTNWRGTHTYRAYIAPWSTATPPANIKYTSNTVDVTWHVRP